MNSLYQICLFGKTEAFSNDLRSEIKSHLEEFGLELGKEVILDVDDSIRKRNPKCASVGLFFGGVPVPVYRRPIALSDYDPILPVVSSMERIRNELPDGASKFNAMAADSPDSVRKIAAATIECLGILPARRRLFLSYIRREAQHIAIQLFNELSKRQFDVFLDTHEIRPGAVFQDVLWHNISDCDVMVMLDTESYFESRWTIEEFGRANLKKAAILRVGFPGVDRDKSLSFTDPYKLCKSHFKSNGTLTMGAIDDLADNIERLRSKSVAVRQSNLVGSLRAAVEHLDGWLGEPGSMRRVIACFPDCKCLQVYPIVGVPTSETIHRIVVHAGQVECALLYDHVGILKSWQKHLKWLGKRIERFHWIKAGSALKGLEDALK